MTRPPVLGVDGAVKHYDGGGVVRALDGVSFELHAGELLGIMGPSGSGKSTLLLIAGLLEPPTAGEVRIGGQRVSWPGADLDGLREVRRRRIGFVFQKPNLIPFLNATENVALALEIDDVPPGPARRHAGGLLRALGLAHRASSLPARLSGGEQQRVAVARALANDPPLILADEPTAALDSVRGRQVIALFRRIADERGAGIAVVTHDPRALDLFDRTIELSDGKLVGASTGIGGLVLQRGLSEGDVERR
ncbi:ABC transporter ATP-binding protein [Azospirillum sp. RWY-5-1]|uniref:ABC transporter ATP-binding protein n=1 Tax=Azospirillum oleiclasticum TaxID=2735135 RepID=A0ABX2TGL3_9PROT|nr:ABC transporter ATP-binding protein [Azospirillum oleiclasticum]NYZ14344.1 ABC transporter ATP-binding protein [Azospirillum oleiclasticum]NYZ23304.1 ABC transporter ATP-binding protein [Azospirillum oleiclasticum]